MIATALAVASLWLPVSVAALQDDPTVEDLSELSAAELEGAWRAALATEPFAAVRREEACLCEMVRRGPDWAEILERRLADLAAEPIGYLGGELESLTALRRVQGRPDPLEVRVRAAHVETNAPDSEAPGGRLTAVFPELPELELELANVDERAVSLQRGGDYRGGRPVRFRPELVDAEGRAAPHLAAPWGIRGGLSTRSLLAPGETVPEVLRLGRYVAPPRPGTYRLRVHYHDRWTIADEATLDGLVTSRSPWLRFEWRPRRLALAPAERARLDRLVAELAAAAERPYAHTTHYRADATVEGTPETRAEAVFREGFAALPSLADALDAPGRTPQERARLLAVLFGISGLVDPRLERGALGEYRFGGGAFGAHGSYSGGKSGRDLDPAAQEPLLARWRALRPWLGDR